MTMQAYLSEVAVVEAQSRFISKVFGWMTVALATTGIVAWYTVSNENVLKFIFANQILFFVLLIAEIGLVVTLSAAINRLSGMTATALFFLYAILNGVTLSFIFVIYTSQSVATAFFITAGTFGAMAIYGYTTKKDLTSIGNMAGMALIGLIIASVVNMFWANSTLYWVVTYGGVLIFVGLTAYDTQKIKQMGPGFATGSEIERKAAILGALRLYLDFINLFLMMLRIFGRRR